jgi:hypothetical protein
MTVNVVLALRVLQKNSGMVDSEEAVASRDGAINGNRSGTATPSIATTAISAIWSDHTP